jgi:hypothetical protein
MLGRLTPAPSSADTQGTGHAESALQTPAAPVNLFSGENFVSSEHRLQRLRELLARIEQLPASSESERMLREVRARVVDVDTGVTPRAMLPVDPVPTVATDPAPPTAHASTAVARTHADHDRGRPGGRPSEPAKSVYAAPREAVSRSGACITTVGLACADDGDWLSLIGADEVLSLDDSASLAPAGEARAGHDRRPWTRGLRG